MATLPIAAALLTYVGAGFWPTLSAPARSQAAFQVLVDNIALVESGYNHRAVGDHGRARGAWQMWLPAWLDGNRQLKKEGRRTYPYGDWQNAWAQSEVADAYLRLCRERLISSGVTDPTPEQYYLCFSMGFAAFKAVGFDPAKCPAKKLDAATRVRNLFDRATR
jgi:hypothetical protein